MAKWKSNQEKKKGGIGLQDLRILGQGPASGLGGGRVGLGGVLGEASGRNESAETHDES